MSNWIIAFLFATGCSAWVYAKMMRKTASDNTSSLVVAGVIFIVLFIAMFILLGFIMPGGGA